MGDGVCGGWGENGKCGGLGVLGGDVFWVFVKVENFVGFEVKF